MTRNEALEADERQPCGAIVGVVATVGGAIGGSMLGVCLTTKSALGKGLIKEKPLVTVGGRHQ